MATAKHGLVLDGAIVLYKGVNFISQGKIKEKAMHPQGPQTISWNLTKLCNLACAHCYLDAGTRAGKRSEELDTAQCKAILDQIKAANSDSLVILTGGEPLLRNDLDGLIAYADSQGLWVVLGTNGTLLTQARADKLKQAGLKGVGISIDALDRETHDRFRGKPGAWDDAVAGVNHAVAAGIDTVVQVTVNPWVVPQLEDLVAFSRDMGAHAVNFYFLVCTGRGQEWTELSPEVAEEVYARLHTLQKKYRGEVLVNAKCAPQYQRYVHQQDPDSLLLHTFQGGCPAGTFYCRIDPKGEVTPCPYIPTSAGNLAQHSLADIWNNTDLFQQLRDRESLQGRCGVCEYQSICSGCRARALADLGDVMAEDPFCRHQPGKGTANGNGGGVLKMPETAFYGKEEPPAEGISWEAEAEQALAKIPPFVRGMVRRRMEGLAQKQGEQVITMAMMKDIRTRMSERLGLNGKPPQ